MAYSSAEQLFRRAESFLAVGDWKSAETACDNILFMEPTNSWAHFYKMLSIMKVKSISELSAMSVNFSENPYYKNAMTYADDFSRAEFEKCCTSCILNIYNAAEKKAKSNEISDLEEAIELFASIRGIWDADDQKDATEKKIRSLKAADRKQKTKKRTIAIVIPTLVIAIAAGAVGGYFSVKSAGGYKNGLNYKVLSDHCVVTGLHTKSLTEIIIPDDIDGTPVTEIKAGAYEGNTALKKVTIGKNITKIGERAFKDCNNLEEIVYNATYCANTATEKSSFKNAGTDAVLTLKVGANVKVIPGGVFTASDVAKLEFAENSSLKRIEASAFAQSSLGEAGDGRIVLPDSIVSIGENAFKDCTIRYNKSGTGNNTCNYIASADNDYFALIEVATTANVKQGIQDGTQVICESALEGVSKGIDYVTRYGNGAYYGSEDNPYLVLITANGTPEIHEDTKFIYSEALSDTNIVTAEIPDGVTSISRAAFKGCGLLRTVKMGDGVQYVGENAFKDCVILDNLTIGKNVLMIDDNAFDNCEALEELLVPSKVNYIGANAFKSCGKLESATFAGEASWEAGYKVIAAGEFEDPEKIAKYLTGSKVGMIWSKQ